MSVSGIIFSNIHDRNIPELTSRRTTGSIPYGCRYRLVDFALSNMVNSGITEVRIITHNNYQSLLDHIGSGKDWDLARRSGGIKILPPYVTSYDSGSQLYNSRLEALIGVQSSIAHITTDYVIMADCDAVFNMDFNDIIESHIRSGAKITLAVKKQSFSGDDARSSVVIKTDSRHNITDVMKNPENITGEHYVSLNIFVMSTSDLKAYIGNAAAHHYSSFLYDIIERNISGPDVKAYIYKGAYDTISSLVDYYNSSMLLINDEDFRRSVFGIVERPIFTKIRNSAPTRYENGAKVSNSLIADGCVINGIVENSILFRGVKIGRNTIVKNSILFQDTYTGENVFLNAVITDTNVLIRDDRILSGHSSMPFYIDKGRMI